MAELNFNSATNYDESTMAQQKQIEDQIIAENMLVSSSQDIECLNEEYKDAPEFLKKIQSLKEKYKVFRRTRPDGNCFYRAFGFAYMESLINEKKDLPRFKEAVENAKEEMLKLGFPSFTLEDFYDTFMEQISTIEGGAQLDWLIQTFNDQGMSDYIVVFLRLLVSCQLQKEADFYQNFIDDGRTVVEFCQQEVEPMGKESDNIHIIALTAITGVAVKIARMDQGAGAFNEHSFPEYLEPGFVLLYRPGHYDILYAK